MIRISKLADYAVVVLECLSGSEQCKSAAVLAGSTGVPEPTVSKILKLLASGGIVVSIRGANGGYTLARSPSEITIEQIISAVDGPVSIAACSDGSEPDCSLSDVCSVRGKWDGVNTAIRNALHNVTLVDMTRMENTNTEEKRYGGH